MMRTVSCAFSGGRKDISTYLLVNSFRKQLVKEGNMLQISDICELLNTELLGVVLEDEHIIISQNHGESMMGKRRHFPDLL